MRVYSYENPVKALADFVSNFYDLFLVDVNMPSMNGFELLNGISPIVLSKEQIYKLIAALKQIEKENFPFKRGVANSHTINIMYAPSEEQQLEDEDIVDIVTLLRPHYLNGTRHDFSLYLSGWLRKENVSIDAARRIMELIAQDDEEKQDRLRTLEATYTKKDLNAIKGYSGFLSVLTDSVHDEQKACQIMEGVSDIIQGTQSPAYEKNEDYNSRTNPRHLIKLAEVNSELFFKDQYGIANVKIKVADHAEIMPIQNKRFEYYLSKLYYDGTGREKVAGSESLNNAVRVLHAEGIFSGEERILNLRVAWADKDKEIHYDLTDPQWRCIRITTKNWDIIKHTDNVLFTRFNQKAQIMPDRNYPLDIFDQYLDLMQVKDASLRILIKVWTVSLLIPDIPHPIDILHGEKGGSKTTFCRCQKRLVDPDKIEINNIPSEKAEFVQQMYHNYLAVYDNVKYVPPWFSDEVCKAVTGSGNSKRTLYTNDDDTIYNYKRPLVVSGILNWLTEPDALDRSLLTEFERISEEQRKEEDKVEVAFEEMRSKLFGYILDMVVKALQIKPTIQLNNLPRMADFTVWGEAIARAMRCGPMVFVNAYKENIGKQNVEAIESNPLAQAIEKFVDSWYEEEKGINIWEGSTKEGLEKIKEIADLHNIDTNARSWPKATNSFKKRLKPILSNLREGLGIDAVIDRQTTANAKIKKNTSTIRIEKKHPPPPPSPQDQNDTQNQNKIGGVRSNSYMQNFVNFYSHSVKTQGAFYVPAGDARISFVDVRDIAAIAVHALTSTNRKHEGKAHNITGGEALSHGQAAEILSERLGKKVNYINVSDEDARKGMKDMGMDEWIINSIIELFEFAKAGHWSAISPVTEQITGNKPISFSQFANDYAGSFK